MRDRRLRSFIHVGPLSHWLGTACGKLGVISTRTEDVPPPPYTPGIGVEAAENGAMEAHPAVGVPPPPPLIPTHGVKAVEIWLRASAPLGAPHKVHEYATKVLD